MNLIFPNPKLIWQEGGSILHEGVNRWFLTSEDSSNSRYVGIIGNYKDGNSFSWNAYSYLDYSANDIGGGKANSLEEAKYKVEETLRAAGVAR